MTDYKQLCADLLRELDHASAWDYQQALKDQARAALAEPEPKGPTPSDEELMALAVAVFEDQFATDKDYARAVLARWGDHPGFPDSSTPQPVPVSERLPLPGDCDEEGRCWWWYPEVPGKTYGYWAYEDDAVPERALNEQPLHWLPAHALPLLS